MRNRLDGELESLREQLTLFGALCEETISGAVATICANDARQRLRVIHYLADVREKERRIEAQCLRLITQQQPVAKDLRMVSAALKMITDMKRIAIQAGEIAEISKYLSDDATTACPALSDMANATMTMVTHAIEAFVRQDVALAEATIDEDDIVDKAFLAAKDSLIQRIAQHPEDGAHALDLLMIAKYFERIGDHAANIASWVVFSVTGLHKGEEN